MLKTDYFDAHHRHKWQCFRIRLVDKVANAPTVNFSGNHAVFRQGVIGNFNLKNHETNDVTPEASLFADVSGSIYTAGNTLLTLRSFA